MVLEDVQTLHKFYQDAVAEMQWFDVKEALRKSNLGEWIIEEGKPKFQLTAEGRRLLGENVTASM